MLRAATCTRTSGASAAAAGRKPERSSAAGSRLRAGPVRPAGPSATAGARKVKLFGARRAASCPGCTPSCPAASRRSRRAAPPPSVGRRRRRAGAAFILLIVVASRRSRSIAQLPAHRRARALGAGCAARRPRRHRRRDRRPCRRRGRRRRSRRASQQVERAVHQVRRHDVGERGRDVVQPPGAAGAPTRAACASSARAEGCPGCRTASTRDDQGTGAAPPRQTFREVGLGT